MKHVIIGAGASGITAAKTIRGLKAEDEILVISTDEHVHSRCMLHHYISGQRDEQALSFVEPDFFAAHNIRWLGGVTVTGVDTQNRKVLFDGGSESFDRLLIATGAKSVMPPMGRLNDAHNVYGLRDLADARSIREQMTRAENIVVIGAGLVGLDAAYGLIHEGKKPIIIEAASAILAQNLDAQVAQAYQAKFEEMGGVFYLNCKVRDAVCDASGKATAVILDNGQTIPCDMVIIATGVRPAVGFLAGSGIAIEHGVLVDSHLATNVSGIYAAGDVAGLSGIWPNAMKQGQTAARNMCGVAAVYEDMFALKNTVNFFGLVSLSVGLLEPAEGDTVMVRQSFRQYEKIILRAGAVVGIILQGDISNSGFWQYLIKNRIKVSSVGKPVWDLSYADFYGIEPDGKYQWVTTA